MARTTKSFEQNKIVFYLHGPITRETKKEHLEKLISSFCAYSMTEGSEKENRLFMYELCVE